MMEIIPKESNPAFREELISLLETAKEWGDTITGYPLEESTEYFMDCLGRLFMEHFQYHVEEARIIAIDYQDQLSEMVRHIEREYLSSMSSIIYAADYDDAAWETACWVRTKMEAFNAMFAPFKVEDKDIIDYMEDRRESARILRSAVPENAPKSHWWWFLHYKF